MSRTTTQTQTLTRNPRTVQFNLTLHNGDPDGDGDGSSSPGSGNHLDESFPCDKVVNVYASIPILYKMKGSYMGANGKKYHVVTPKGNIYSMIQDVLDPEEFRIYEPLIFLDKSKVLIPYRADKKIPSKGQEWLFVRCQNNSLHIIAPSDLVNNVAGQRYKYRKASAEKKQEMDKTNHYVFQREAQNAKRKIQKMLACDNTLQKDCKETLESSCEDEAKDPNVLKTIYDLGYRTTKNPGRTWEEVCYTNEIPTVATSGRKSSRSSVTGGKKRK